MKKSKMNGCEKLTKAELEGVYAVLNGKIVDLEPINWNYNFMQDILDGVSENILSTTATSRLFKKLFLMSNSELLDIIINSDTYWGNKDSDYKRFAKISPNAKQLEVVEVQSPFAGDTNISELQFLMISQTLQNDLIVTVSESDSNNNEEDMVTIWSANRDNFHELLDELTLNEKSITIQKLQKVKENIFK